MRNAKYPILAQREAAFQMPRMSLQDSPASSAQYIAPRRTATIASQIVPTKNRIANPVK